jgi:hypothetical protein
MTDIESRKLMSVGEREESNRLTVEEVKYKENLSVCMFSA